MKIVYTIGDAEIRDAVHAHRKTYRWTVFRPFLAVLAILIFVGASLGLLRASGLSLPALFVGVYLFFANSIYERKLAKQLGGLMKGEHILELVDDIIKETCGQTTSEVKIGNIKAVYEGDKVIMFYLARISFFAIPKSAFSDEIEKRKFVALFPTAKPSSL